MLGKFFHFYAENALKMRKMRILPKDADPYPRILSDALYKPLNHRGHQSLTNCIMHVSCFIFVSYIFFLYIFFYVFITLL